MVRLFCLLVHFVTITFVVAVYPSDYYSMNENSFSSNVYTSFNKHCGKTAPYFTIDSNSEYHIYGKAPITSSSPYADSATGYTLKSYLSQVPCSFTIVGPKDSQLKLAFNDSTCSQWPPLCSVMVFDGDTAAFTSKNILMSIPSPVEMSGGLCFNELTTKTNVMSVIIANCLQGPSSNFNFSMAVSVASTQSGPSSNDLLSTQSIITIVTVVVSVTILVTVGVLAVKYWFFRKFQKSQPEVVVSAAQSEEESMDPNSIITMQPITDKVADIISIISSGDPHCDYYLRASQLVDEVIVNLEAVMVDASCYYKHLQQQHQQRKRLLRQPLTYSKSLPATSLPSSPSSLVPADGHQNLRRLQSTASRTFVDDS